MKKLKVGIIGLGRIASLYESDGRARKYYPALTHAGAYSKNSTVSITCGADIKRKRTALFGKRWRVKNLYSDYRKMLREEKIDILSICTPPGEHIGIIREAVGRVPVIFCEKPFTRSSAEIMQIIKLASLRGTRIAVNLYRQYDTSHDKVRDMLKRGLLGRIQRVNCYYGKGLRNMASHVLGYLLSILGRPVKVQVLGKKKYEGINELSFDVYLEFKGGIPVFIQSCDFNKYRLFELDFICEKGRIQILDEGLTIKISSISENKAQSGAFELREKKKALKSTLGRSLSGAIEHLIRMKADRTIKPIVSPEKYLELQELIEEIEKKGRAL